MSLRFAVLGLLTQRPMTGFDLLREFDIARSVIWPAPKNEVYRVLAGLTEDGLIAESAFGARGAKTYDATDAGRAALRAWLDEPSNYTMRYDPILKALFLRGNEGRAVRRKRAAEDLAFFESQIAAIEDAERRKTPEDPRGDARDMALGLYRALAAWARGVLAQSE